jgi:hypothetical protein
LSEKRKIFQHETNTHHELGSRFEANLATLPRYNHAFAGDRGLGFCDRAKPKEKHVKTKTLDEMAGSQVLAMALDDMEFLGLFKWKPDADKKPTINETPPCCWDRTSSDSRDVVAGTSARGCDQFALIRFAQATLARPTEPTKLKCRLRHNREWSRQFIRFGAVSD